jgi:hypothetical protein
MVWAARAVVDDSTMPWSMRFHLLCDSAQTGFCRGGEWDESMRFGSDGGGGRGEVVVSSRARVVIDGEGQRNGEWNRLCRRIELSGWWMGGGDLR